MKGFSLVELLVVLVIISLAMVWVLPRFSGAYNRLQLKSTTRKMAATFRRAQGYAMVKKQAVRLLFDVDQGAIEITSPPSEKNSGENSKGAAGTALRKFQVPAGMTLTLDIETQWDTDLNPPALWFYPDGSSNGGRAILADVASEQGWQILVDGLAGTSKITPVFAN